MNKKALSLIAAMALALSTFAANIKTDRSWYLAGEAMQISISAENALIAYAELCETHGLAAGTMVSLRGGEGTGLIELPKDLHSGYYVLSVYSRGNADVAQQLVAVINPLQKSKDDDIKWVQVAHPDSLSYAETTPVTYLLSPRSSLPSPFSSPEVEGHVIRAHIQNIYDGHSFKASEIRPSLSIIGKQIHYFEGKMMNDSTAVFHTFGIHGKQPLVLSATTATGKNLPIEMISPFAALLPKELPHLVFHYKRSEVEARSIDMQRRQIAIAPAKREQKIGEDARDTAEEVQPLDYDPKVFGTEPDLSYNLDQYRQFHTVNEVLIEYVLYVKKTTINGIPRLIVRREQDNFNSLLPTLVLIDGMPVNNIAPLLNYDARRVNYINIYGGQYIFGNDIYNGILSFITRSGRLTNYPTEPNTQYLVYEFPQ